MIEVTSSEIAYINSKIHSLHISIAAEQEENCKQEESNHDCENNKEARDKPQKNSIKTGEAEPSYNVAVRILQNLDQFESYAILESFFKDIIELRTGDWSRQMILEQQEKTIIDLRNSLLAMQRATAFTTSEYEKKNGELEEALRLEERSETPTKDDGFDSTKNKYNVERRGSVASAASVIGVTKNYEEILATLEGSEKNTA
ncbi:hypothetical protein GLOIN_2v1501181 [Rhizophagus irregularis DAOM 181602=DAOM 197198]|uniref:Uncharacterized protein n=1 Tax=Rhizophagus irregularis (strain DAOM 181602 / DAOM 197198 / MUCL 43194) TaxID=747089 RepID=A0A2P4QWP0_RHIID|nr:hypothetical protein GLOIN_2v1501181 [Rhizophagus irregularis DAOM 181602=DAOM 197198]POG81968.1 hypothetical protein GLOIN_2v1501181 [Rhizophagus irregularis DAOM 181602=DAOM 197198]|eukprot:XP_025188834.1 hypothetical protein GLOIN_2v1501181 [Rhizophagus irregularis DAOM 181602=DAOM 197198]